MVETGLDAMALLVDAIVALAIAMLVDVAIATVLCEVETLLTTVD